MSQNNHVLMVGLGRQGQRILELLLEKGFHPISLSDTRQEVLEGLKNRFGNRVTLVSRDIFEMSETDRVAFLKGFGYLVDALPSDRSYALLKSATQAGSKAVSISFLKQDFMELDVVARKNGALIVPDCGIAPGFSHLLAGYSVNKLDGAAKVLMKLGALPKQPVPPFCHNLTWSVEDLIEEYTRPAKVRRRGHLAEVDPFAEIRREKIMGFELESFVTDGARSFLTNFPKVPHVEERTLRYKGHLDYMKGLKASGPLDAKKIEREFGNLSPEDRFVMEIEVENSRGKTTERIVHRYLMEYNVEGKIPALVNAVAVTAAETLRLIREGVMRQTGVFPLELLATKRVYDSLVAAHQQMGARIEVQ